MKWYEHESAEIYEKLSTTFSNGLSRGEAEKRLNKYGYNEITKGKSISSFTLLIVQFKNPMLIILIVAAILSFIGNHILDTVVIIILVFINATISFIEERSAKKSIDSLMDMSAPQATVLRNGNWVAIEAKKVVPGDIVKINTGDVIVADLRVIESMHLQIDESALTGESEPVEKKKDALVHQEGKTPIGDRVNMGFMSTVVTGGNGIGVVTETGMNTEVGHIASMMRIAGSSKTPMQKRVDKLSHILIALSIGAAAAVIGIGILIGQNLMEMVQTGLSLAVAAIPEGLPTIVTIVLTIGARKMAKNNALVRDLGSVETLGSTTIICSDKTGTLTQNQMQVVAYWSGGKSFTITGKGFETKGKFIAKDGTEIDVENCLELKYGLKISALCNAGGLNTRDGSFEKFGTPTEIALVVAAQKAGIWKTDLLNKGHEYIRSFPFDSNRKMSSVIVKNPKGKYFLMSVGAPDVISSRSSNIFWNGAQGNIEEYQKKCIHDAIENYASKAYRTLAVAYREITFDEIDKAKELHESDLTLLAIHGIIDPPRPEVVKSIEICRKAGIKTVMITGDHAVTAREIAKQIGIIQTKKDLVMKGAEIDIISDNKLAKLVKKVTVFARVSPEHKLRIVKAFQENGHITAMTGDGVNDAPALRKSELGIAMGIAGTQVAKESSDLVLLDDNFSTIVSAVSYGRRIYDNIRKYLRECLTANVAEVSAILFAFIVMNERQIVPLTAIMILWINLFSDAFPSLMLGWENDEPGLMKRRPTLNNVSFFSEGLGIKILIRGLINGLFVYLMFSFSIYKNFGIAYSQTFAFVAIIFVQNFHIFDARTLTSIFKRNPFENQKLFWSVIFTSVVSISFIYFPFGNELLGTTPISIRHLTMVIALSALPTFILSGIRDIFNLKWL
ncbi:MAG TPA: cation-translocating P-type ATPase [Victivallales bacterium]|nr:cation-translocating P-type ATPase [Victivallales bacterium]